MGSDSLGQASGRGLWTQAGRDRSIACEEGCTAEVRERCAVSKVVVAGWLEGWVLSGGEIRLAGLEPSPRHSQG